MPNIKIERQDKQYHLHHWAIFSASYLPLLLMRRRMKWKIIHGFFIGSILQGLTYNDRFKFIKPIEDFGSKSAVKLEPVLEIQNKK